jgi:hypothetical protein
MHVVVRQTSWQFSRGRGFCSNDNPSGNFWLSEPDRDTKSRINIAGCHAA